MQKRTPHKEKCDKSEKVLISVMLQNIPKICTRDYLVEILSEGTSLFGLKMLPGNQAEAIF